MSNDNAERILMRAAIEDTDSADTDVVEYQLGNLKRRRSNIKERMDDATSEQMAAIDRAQFKGVEKQIEVLEEWLEKR